MSDCAVALSDVLVKKNFGEPAVHIIRCMHIRGPVTIKELDRFIHGKLTPKKTALCLTTLLRHGILEVTHELPLTYSFNLQAVVRIARIPMYCHLGRLVHGVDGENLLIVCFVTGMAKASEVLRAALLRSSEDNKYEKSVKLVDTLDVMIKSGVIRAFIKSPITEATEETAAFERFSISKSELLENLQNFVSIEAKAEHFRRHLPLIGKSREWDFTLIPNANALECLWRDRIISQLASERIDVAAGEIMSRLLSIAVASKEHGHLLSSISESVSLAQMCKTFQHLPEYLDSYITLLLDDPFSFLEETPGISGGIYFCPYKKVVKNILVRHIENIVQVLFDNSGVRIFRILIAEGYLSSESLEKRLLIPQQEFRKTLPQMVASGFISSTELSRSKEFNADTIVCLYCVNLPLVARLTIEYAQNSLLCIHSRYDAELNSKSRLVEHRYRVEDLLRQHRAKLADLESHEPSDEFRQQMEAHKESIQALKVNVTPPELGQLSSIAFRLAKLSAVHWEAEAAWFVADLYIRLYSNDAK